jgi:hypothetical protein
VISGNNYVPSWEKIELCNWLSIAARMEEENVRQDLLQWPLSGGQRGGEMERRLLWKLEAADRKETDKG